VDYHKLLEELCEAADIYIARYMNNDTHTGSDYHILRIYEAWCFKKRTSFAKLFNGNYGMKTGYVIDNDNVKARFIKEMLEEAERIPDRNKHALSIINLRRHAQPALDHLAAFQARVPLLPACRPPPPPPAACRLPPATCLSAPHSMLQRVSIPRSLTPNRATAR